MGKSSISFTEKGRLTTKTNWSFIVTSARTVDSIKWANLWRIKTKCTSCQTFTRLDKMLLPLTTKKRFYSGEKKLAKLSKKLTRHPPSIRKSIPVMTAGLDSTFFGVLKCIKSSCIWVREKIQVLKHKQLCMVAVSEILTTWALFSNGPAFRYDCQNNFFDNQAVLTQSKDVEDQTKVSGQSRAKEEHLKSNFLTKVKSKWMFLSHRSFDLNLNWYRWTSLYLVICGLFICEFAYSHL